MSASLRALLDGIIDYAGLFPPAKLPMDQAIRNYARYRTEPESWMLGRFICPASRLGELKGFRHELFETGPPFGFSALGTGGRTRGEFLGGLEDDITDIDAFQKGYESRLIVDVYEVRIPAELVHFKSEVHLEPLVPNTDLMSYDVDWVMLRCSVKLGLRKPRGIACFFEVEPTTSLDPDAARRVARLIDSIDGLRSGVAMQQHVNRINNGLAERGSVGFKMRCGGVTAAAFPTAVQVAKILARRDLTMKCTAGLHHPLRHWDASLNVHMHGFINVFGAGVLAQKHGLNVEQIQTILEDEDPADFSFTDVSFRWRDLEICTPEIIKARAMRMTSFGSCSFDEPREDLKRLGWL